MQISFYYFFFLFLFLYFLCKNLGIVRNKKLPPSPGLSLPIIGHLYLFNKPLHRTFADLSVKHGPILFLKFGYRPVILVSSPEAAEECFTKNDLIFANRPNLLAGKHLGFNYSTLVWASYGDHWRNLRRIASIELLSFHRLQMFYEIRDEEVRSVVRRLFRKSESGEFATVDMKSMFFELMLNAMMRMIAGKRYYGENKEELEEESRFREIVRETFEVSGATNIGDYVPVLKWVGLNNIEKKLAVLGGKRDKFMQELIEEHKKARTESGSEKKSRTMIDVLLKLQENEPEYYTDEIIRGLIQVLLAAGTDTSAATMEWGMSLLVNNPEVLKKAQNEIHSVIGDDKLMNESDTSKLPYLHCIMNEVMRMYPAAPLLAPHESSKECLIGGYKVPSGTMLLVNQWSIQNDPKYWDEPTKFKPERFEGVEGARDGFKMMPFGSGRRRCPGEGLALRMVGLALGSILQCFEWERVGEELVDMTEGLGLTMPKARPLIVKCTPLPSMLNLLSQL